MSRRVRRFGLVLFGVVGMLTGCETARIADNAVPTGTFHTISMLGAGYAFAILLVIAVSIGRQAIAHHHAVRRLRRDARPAVVEGHQVASVPGMAAAVVAGIIRPTVYCADDLAARLDREQLRALLWHEDHHRLTRAPARLVLLVGIGRALGWIPIVDAVIQRACAAIEIAADEHAIRAGSSRRALARTIIRLQDSPAEAGAAAFVSAADLRIRALLGESRESSAGWAEAVVSLGAGAAVALAACVAVLGAG